jgi:hypothetical protein
LLYKLETSLDVSVFEKSLTNFGGFGTSGKSPWADRLPTNNRTIIIERKYL